MKTAYLETLGCRLNQSETALIAGGLQSRGIATTPHPEKADFIVINTCTVTAQADAKCRQKVRSLHRRNPSAKIAVVGCYAQTSSEEVAILPGVSVVLGNEDKLALPEKLADWENSETSVNQVRKIGREPFTIPSAKQKSGTTRANLKIQDGCDFMCAFCVIPFARGRSRSRAFDDLLAEASALAKSGVKEIVLTGVNLGLYREGTREFPHILEALEKIEGLCRIRISSIEPTTVSKDLFVRMADSDSKLVPHLHLPLQSASDEVLRSMRRRYDFEYFSDFVETAKAAVPDICIGTDVIAGFPGETGDLFNEALENLANLPVDYFHAFPFSPRKRTRAFRMEGRVSSEALKRWIGLLKELDERKRKVFSSAYVGREMEVLFESPDRQGGWNGLSGNYQRVRCEFPGIAKGRIGRVRIQRTGRSSLFGEWIASA